METDILLHIIELGLFLVCLGLCALVKWRQPRSVFIRVLIVTEIALTIIGGVLLGVYDVVTFLIGN